jgi:hypothetical protein
MNGILAIWLVEKLIVLCGFLLVSIMGLYMWMSRRELTRNEEHKREMSQQQKEYMLLHIEVVNERLHAIEKSMDKIEQKSEQADFEIKGELENRKTNEHTLFKRDEEQYAVMAKERSVLNKELGDLRSQLASLESRK